MESSFSWKAFGEGKSDTSPTTQSEQIQQTEACLLRPQVAMRRHSEIHRTIEQCAYHAYTDSIGIASCLTLASEVEKSWMKDAANL